MFLIERSTEGFSNVLVRNHEVIAVTDDYYPKKEVIDKLIEIENNRCGPSITVSFIGMKDRKQIPMNDEITSREFVFVHECAATTGSTSYVKNTYRIRPVKKI